MHQLPTRQRGIGLLALMFILAIVLFFVLLGMKMVPRYVQYYSVVEVLEAIANDPQYHDASPRELKKAFERRLDINGVYDFPKKGLSIERSGKGGMLMKVKYENREHVAGNVDVVMHFEHQVTIPGR